MGALERSVPAGAVDEVEEGLSGFGATDVVDDHAGGGGRARLGRDMGCHGDLRMRPVGVIGGQRLDLEDIQLRRPKLLQRLQSH